MKLCIVPSLNRVEQIDDGKDYVRGLQIGYFYDLEIRFPNASERAVYGNYWATCYTYVSESLSWIMIVQCIVHGNRTNVVGQ